MPGNYAHHRFGTQILPLLPPEIRRTVNRFRQLYDMGQHGPDLLLYFDPPFPNAVATLSRKCHQQTGAEFFKRACRVLRMAPSEGAMAYLYGVLGHYVLDATCHPYISRMTEQGIGRHNQIETAFDQQLLTLDGKTPHLYDQSGHLQLTPGECQTVAMFYPNLRSAAVKQCVKRMRACTQFLTLPEGGRRKLISGALGLVRPGAADLIIPLQPEEALQECNANLLRLYDMALERYIPMLEQIQDHMKRKTPLGTDFSLIFG